VTKLQKILIGAGVVVVIGAVIGASLLGKESAKGEEVNMAKAKKKDLVSFVSATGKIEAKTKVNVQSSVIGEIVDLPVKEGDAVKKGDLLVQIDPERYRQEVQRLEALLRVTGIAIEESEVTLVNLQRTFNRRTELYGSGGVVSKELMEQSELDYRTAEINLKRLKEQVKQASADLGKAKDDLRKTTIRSPIEGIVTQLNAEKGEITLTGTMNNPGTVIMVVSDMSEILAEVDVDENRVVRVTPGQSARVVVDAVGEAHPYGGKVFEIAGTAVQRTGQQVQVFPVKVVLDQVDEKLRPGMTAKARIETQRADGVVTVPIQSVFLRPQSVVDEALSGKKADDKDAKKAKDKEPAKASPAAVEKKSSEAGSKSADEREVVFKVVDGKVVLTPVKSGISDETDVVIVEGLKDGETVVTGPYRSVKSLKHGDLVREKKASGESDRGGGVQVEVD
jgi:HlyD family secretion protein